MVGWQPRRREDIRDQEIAMAQWPDGEFLLPLFPLPNLVFFPQTRMPLHIYAQRTWLADLSRQYLHYLPEQATVPEIESVGLEPLTNALIMSLNLDVEEKQRLLEADDLLARAEEVGNELQRRIESSQALGPYRQSGDPRWN